MKINFHPTRTELRWFSGLLIPFCALIALWVYRGTGSAPASLMLFGIGAAAGILGLASPPLLRPVYIAWTAAVFPIGWAVSHVMLAIIFYFVVTPVALLMKVVGRDPMYRRFDPSAQTYWIERRGERPMSSYFRQY